RVGAAAGAEPLRAGGAPVLAAGARGERVEVTVVGADEEPVAEQRRASLHLVAGLEAPADAAGALVERVHLPAPVADVDAPVRDERRGLRRADLRSPARLAVPDLERRDHAVEPGTRLVALAAVHEAREDGLDVDVGRGGGASARRDGGQVTGRSSAGVRCGVVCVVTNSTLAEPWMFRDWWRL